MNVKKFKAVIFDFDGTLYDNSGIGKALVFSAPLDMFKIRADRIARKRLWGCDENSQEKFDEIFFERASKFAHVSSKKYKKWYEERYQKIFLNALKKKRFRARPNVEKIFSSLCESGAKIAIFSDYKNVRERMLAIGIPEKSMELCAGFFSAPEFGCLKPAPRGFLQVAGNLGVAPKQCLVVGDRADTDGQGALHAGMNFIQIKPHENPEEKNDVKLFGNNQAQILNARLKKGAQKFSASSNFASHEILDWNEFANLCFLDAI